MKAFAEIFRNVVEFLAAIVAVLLAFTIGVLTIFDIVPSDFWADKAVSVISVLLSLNLVGITIVWFRVRDLQSGMGSRVLDHLKHRLGSLSGPVQKIYGEDIAQLTDQIYNFYEENTFTVYGSENFQAFWSRTIKQFPGAEVLATSLPSQIYFWGPRSGLSPIDEAIKSLIDSGGTMTRIFFVQNFEDVRQPDVSEVMDHQLDLGVRTLVCEVTTEVQTRFLNKLVLCDKALRFGWEVKTSGLNITKAEAAIARKDIQKYADHIETLMTPHFVQEYTRGGGLKPFEK